MLAKYNTWRKLQPGAPTGNGNGTSNPKRKRHDTDPNAIHSRASAPQLPSAANTKSITAPPPKTSMDTRTFTKPAVLALASPSQPKYKPEPRAKPASPDKPASPSENSPFRRSPIRPPIPPRSPYTPRTKARKRLRGEYVPQTPISKRLRRTLGTSPLSNKKDQADQDSHPAKTQHPSRMDLGDPEKPELPTISQGGFRPREGENAPGEGKRANLEDDEEEEEDDQALGPTPPPMRSQGQSTYRPWLPTGSPSRSPTAPRSRLLPQQQLTSIPEMGQLVPGPRASDSRTRGPVKRKRQSSQLAPASFAAVPTSGPGEFQAEHELEGVNKTEHVDTVAGAGVQPTSDAEMHPAELDPVDAAPYPTASNDTEVSAMDTDPQPDAEPDVAAETQSPLRHETTHVLRWSEDEDDYPTKHVGRTGVQSGDKEKKKVNVQMESFAAERIDRVHWDPEDELGWSLGPDLLLETSGTAEHMPEASASLSLDVRNSDRGQDKANGAETKGDQRRNLEERSEKPPSLQPDENALSHDCTTGSVTTPVLADEADHLLGLGRLRLAPSPRRKSRKQHAWEEEQCVQRLLMPLGVEEKFLSTWDDIDDPSRNQRGKIIAPRKFKPAARRRRTRGQSQDDENGEDGAPSQDVESARLGADVGPGEEPQQLFQRAGRVGVGDAEDMELWGDEDWASEPEDDEAGWGRGEVEWGDVL